MKTFQALILMLLAVSACQPKKASSPATSAPAAPTSTMSELQTAQERVKAAPNFENYTDLGIAYVHLKMPGQAMQAFRKSAELKPDSAIAQNNLCSQYIELRQWKPARENCAAALKLAPGLQIAANNLKLIDQSIAALKAEIASMTPKLGGLKGPERTDTLLNLGYRHYQLGDYAQSIQVWSRIPKNDPKYPVALNNLASSNILLGKLEVAGRQLDEAEKLDPRNPLIANNKVWLKDAASEQAK